MHSLFFNLLNQKAMSDQVENPEVEQTETTDPTQEGGAEQEVVAPVEETEEVPA